MRSSMRLVTLGAVGCAVGSDHALVDAQGSFDLDVSISAEQNPEASGLLAGEKVDTGVEGVSGAAERVPGSAAMPMELLLEQLRWRNEKPLLRHRVRTR